MGGRDVRVVTVVGAGTMGHGIAEIAAMAGIEVYMADVSREILEGALERIRWSLGKLRERGVLRESPEAVLSRIKPIVSLEDSGYSRELADALSESQAMIEAVPEKLELKQGLFEFAGIHAPDDAILATNTSSLPITEIASRTRRPERVVGMHFFNPPVLMQLVEIIRGERTSDETVEAAVDLARRLGKTPVVVRKDVPGFIVNRLLGHLMMVSCLLVERRGYSIEEVDSTARYSMGLPMGVFELADYSGIDVFYYVFEAMTARGFPSVECRLFEDKYRAGEYGVKTGRGFYGYPEPGKFVKPSVPREAAGRVRPQTLLAPVVNEASRLLREGIASKEDIDTAVKLGLGWPKGVFELADDYGLDTIVEALRELESETGLAAYKPDELLDRLVREGKKGRKTGSGFYEYGEVTEEARETIVVRREKPIAWIELNRPDKLNAINPKMIEELWQALEELEADDSVRVIIIKGSGRAFSSGADVAGFPAASPIEIARFSRRFQELTLRVQFLAKPVIVAIHGYALGGGLELAMSGDIRIASEDAKLGQPEINLGFIPGAGATQRLVRLVGPARAKELVMTGDMIPAREAYETGLVNRVVARGRLEEEARALALKLAEKPPLALVAAKHAIDYGAEAGLWPGLALESSLFGLLFSTQDVMEGVAAFLQRRKPEFKGR